MLPYLDPDFQRQVGQHPTISILGVHAHDQTKSVPRPLMQVYLH